MKTNLPREGCIEDEIALEFPDNYAGVMSAEAEGIAQCDIDFGFPGLEGDEIHFQVAARIGIL